MGPEKSVKRLKGLLNQCNCTGDSGNPENSSITGFESLNKRRGVFILGIVEENPVMFPELFAFNECLSLLQLDVREILRGATGYPW